VIMNEQEKLSLKSSEIITDMAYEEMNRTPGLTFSAACYRVLAREPHLVAGYAGDTEKFAELSAKGRATRMAAPGGRERHFRRGGPPRALSSRAIAHRSQLRDGEVLCVCLAPPSAGGGLFAELVA
jgi:hypothetical protein